MEIITIWDETTLISHDHKAIFVHIQKTAGSSINSVFRWTHHLTDKHFRANQLRPLYGESIWEDYFKFAFVRNPWDRMVSWWLMIDAHRSDYNAGGKFNNFQSYVLEKAKTFQDFLLLATDEIKDRDGEKSILRNQIDYLTDDNGKIIVDYIGRFESLHHDFTIISERCFGRALDLPHINRSSNKGYTQHYTPELSHLVAERFARDIAAFGYTFGGDGGAGRLDRLGNHAPPPNPYP